MTALKDPGMFFGELREAKLLGAAIDQTEVDGINVILAACGAENWPLGFTAYALATAYHETAGTMQPIKSL